MRYLISILAVLIMALPSIAAPAVNVSLAVFATNNTGRLDTPSNFFYTNILVGTNIVIERLPTGRIRINSVVGGSGNFSNLTVTNLTVVSNLTLGTNIIYSLAQGTNILFVTNGQVLTIHGTVVPSGGTNTLYQTNGVTIGSAGTENWTSGVTGSISGAIVRLGVNIDTNAFQPGSTTLTNLAGTGAITNLQSAVGIQLGTNAGIIYITNLVAGMTNFFLTTNDQFITAVDSNYFEVVNQQLNLTNQNLTNWSLFSTNILTALAETNWINDAGVLRPISAGAIHGTNVSFWEKLIAKSAFITEDRARTLVLGTNVVQALTNSFLLLDSPTSDATLVIVELTAASSSGQWLLLLNNQTNRGFSIFDGSGTGTGIVDLQGDFVTTNKGRGLLLVHNGVTWNEIGRFDTGGQVPEVEGSGIVNTLPIWTTTNTLGNSLVYQITNAPFAPPTDASKALISAGGIFRPEMFIQNTTSGLSAGDQTQFDFTGQLFYRLAITNNSATNRTFKLGTWFRSFQSNDVAEILLEFNGGASMTLSNTGNAFLLTNWIASEVGDRIRLNWNSLRTRWEEQWRYPPITTNAVGGSGTVTSVGLAEISSGDDLFEITGSPVTTSGTLSFAMTNEFLTNWAKISTNVLAANKSPFTNDSGIVTYLLQNTNVFRFYQTNGSLYIGSNTLAALGVPYPANAYAVASVRNTQLGEANLNGFYLETKNGGTSGALDLVARSNNASFQIRKLPGPYRHIFTASTDGIDYVMRATNDFPMVEFLPTIPSGTVPYKFDTEFYHTTGYLLTVGNSNTAVFKVPYAVVKGALTNDGAGGWGYYDLAGITGSGAMRSVSTNGIIVSSPVTNVNFVTPAGSNIRITGIDDTGNAQLDFTLSSASLNNIAGTGAVTNVVSLSTTNATSKPLTNSFTSGVLTLWGLEAGANVSITANGSNYVIASSGSPSSLTVASNGNIFATGVTNVNFVNVTTITNADGDVSINPLGLVGEIWFQSGNAIFPRHYTNSNGRLALGTNTISSSAYLRIDNSDVTVPYAVFTANDIERSRIDSNGVFSVTGTSEGFSLQGNSIYSISNVSGLILTTNGPLLGIAIPQSATNIVWTNTLFVSPSGNNATAQRNNPNRPWKSILLAVSNALRGDVVFLYPGTFVMGDQEIRLTNGVSLVGSGANASVITYTADISGNGPAIQPGDNTIIADLSCLLDPAFLEAQSSAAIGFGNLSDGTNATNVVVRNCKFSGSSDCAYFDMTGPLLNSIVQIDFYNCTFNTRWDAMAMFGGRDESRINFYDCFFYGDLFNNTWGQNLSACNCTGGTVGFYGCNITFIDTGTNVTGPYAIQSSSSSNQDGTTTNRVYLAGNFFDVRGTNSFDVRANNFGKVFIQQNLSANRVTAMTSGIVQWSETNKFLTHISSSSTVTNKWPITNAINGQVLGALASGQLYWTNMASVAPSSLTVASNGVIVATSVTNLNLIGNTLVTNASGNVSFGFPTTAGSSITFSNQLWVDKSGNNATAERNNPGKPYADLYAALTASIAGDVVNLNVGRWRCTNEINIPIGVGILGVSTEATVVENYRIDAPLFTINNNVFLGQLQITNAVMDDDFQMHIGGSVGINATNAVGWNLLTYGDSDSLYFGQASSTNFITFIDCRLRSKWDIIVAKNGAHNLTFQNCSILVTGPSVFTPGSPANGIDLEAGSTITMYDSHLIACCSGVTDLALTQSGGTASFYNTLLLPRALSITGGTRNYYPDLQLLGGTGIVLTTNNIGAVTITSSMGLQQLTNVVAASPADGDVLAWNNAMKKWTNVVPATSGGSVSFDPLSLSDPRVTDYQQMRGLGFTNRSQIRQSVEGTPGTLTENTILVSNYFYVASSSDDPGWITRYQINDLTQTNILNFANDGFHSNSVVMTYPGNGFIYAIHDNEARTTISKIDIVNFTTTDFIVDTAQPSTFTRTGCALTSDADFLYALVRTNSAGDTWIIKYRISDGTKISTLVLTNMLRGFRIRSDGTDLYACGWGASPELTNAWLAKIATNMSSFTWTNISAKKIHPFKPVFVGDNVWLSGTEAGLDGTSKGAWLRINKDTLAQESFYTGIDEPCEALCFDGRYLWGVTFTSPGMLVQFSPDAGIFRQRTLETAEAFPLEIQSDGQRLFIVCYTGTQRVIRMVSPAFDNQWVFAQANTNAPLKITSTEALHWTRTAVAGQVSLITPTVPTDTLRVTNMIVGAGGITLSNNTAPVSEDTSWRVYTSGTDGFSLDQNVAGSGVNRVLIATNGAFIVTPPEGRSSSTGIRYRRNSAEGFGALFEVRTNGMIWSDTNKFAYGVITNIWPLTNGLAGQLLTVDGNNPGLLYWSTVTGGAGGGNTIQSNSVFITSTAATNINVIDGTEVQFLSTNASGNVSIQPVLRFQPLHKSANAVGTFSTNFIDFSANMVQTFTNGLQTNMVCIVTNLNVADVIMVDFYGSASEGRTNACTVQFVAPSSPAGFVYRWPLGATNGNYDFVINSNQFAQVQIHAPRSTNCWVSYRVFGNE